MEIQTPFITPVAVFDISKHLPLLRSLFEETKKENLFGLVSPGFKTTLTDPAVSKIKNAFPQSNEMTELKQDIKNASIELATYMGYRGEDRYEPSIDKFWLNEMNSDATHPPHSHYGCHFSGCIYVDIPGDSGKIVFLSPKERYDRLSIDSAQHTVFNSMSWGFDPKEGQLFLWESWIRHFVPAATFEGVRRSVGLDVIMDIKG